MHCSQNIEKIPSVNYDRKLKPQLSCAFTLYLSYGKVLTLAIAEQNTLIKSKKIWKQQYLPSGLGLELSPSFASHLQERYTTALKNYYLVKIKLSSTFASLSVTLQLVISKTGARWFVIVSFEADMLTAMSSITRVCSCKEKSTNQAQETVLQVEH